MARKIAFILLIVACILWVGFIFSNSLDNGNESGEKSAGVTEFVNKVAIAVGIEKTISHAFVRNMAHFVEFSVLALLSSAAIAVGIYPRVKIHLVYALLFSAISVPFSFIIAVIDELIQKFFSTGRACQLTDVLLDTCGALCGAALFALSYILFTVIKDKCDKQRQKGLSHLARPKKSDNK